MDGNGILHIES